MNPFRSLRCVGVDESDTAPLGCRGRGPFAQAARGASGRRSRRRRRGGGTGYDFRRIRSGGAANICFEDFASILDIHVAPQHFRGGPFLPLAPLKKNPLCVAARRFRRARESQPRRTVRGIIDARSRNNARPSRPRTVLGRQLAPARPATRRLRGRARAPRDTSAPSLLPFLKLPRINQVRIAPGTTVLVQVVRRWRTTGRVLVLIRPLGNWDKLLAVLTRLCTGLVPVLAWGGLVLHVAGGGLTTPRHPGGALDELCPARARVEPFFSRMGRKDEVVRNRRCTCRPPPLTGARPSRACGFLCCCYLFRIIFRSGRRWRGNRRVPRAFILIVRCNRTSAKDVGGQGGAAM